MKEFPFQMLNRLLVHGPELLVEALDTFLVTLGAISIIAGVTLGGCILPLILNPKFDPIFGPKSGEKWEMGKGPAFYAYPFTRALDYAKAIVSDKFSQSKFRVPSTELRAKVSRSTVVISHVFIFSYWCFGAILIFGIFAQIAEKIFPS